MFLRACSVLSAIYLLLVIQAAAAPRNLGSEAGETTEASDTRADRLFGGVLSDKAYNEEMDKLGPGVISILIQRYHEVPDKMELRGFKMAIIDTTFDAVLHFEGSTSHPLGTARRKDALEFFASLLSSNDVSIKERAMEAIKQCAQKFPVDDPFVIDATFNLMQTEEKSGYSLRTAIEAMAAMGHDEATAQRLNDVINKRLSSKQSPSDNTLDVARQAVQNIRQRANSPSTSSR